MRKILAVTSLWLGVAALVTANMSFPKFLRMKGRFTDTKTPMTDVLPVHFSIWNSPTNDGDKLWEDTQEVAVQDNHFQVVLGRARALTPSVFSGGDRWLEIRLGTDEPMRPRHRIPNNTLQAQVAAVQMEAEPVVVERKAPPEPILTETERRELEMQIEPVRETPKPVKAVVPVKTVVVPVAKPVPPKPVVTSPGAPIQGPTYIVKNGDTLKSIAQKLYGNAELWYDLYYLNRDRLGPMGHLFAGQILVLPTDAGGKAK